MARKLAAFRKNCVSAWFGSVTARSMKRTSWVLWSTISITSAIPTLSWSYNLWFPGPSFTTWMTNACIVDRASSVVGCAQTNVHRLHCTFCALSLLTNFIANDNFAIKFIMNTVRTDNRFCMRPATLRVMLDESSGSRWYQAVSSFWRGSGVRFSSALSWGSLVVEKL